MLEALHLYDTNCMQLPIASMLTPHAPVNLCVCNRHNLDHCMIYLTYKPFHHTPTALPVGDDISHFFGQGCLGWQQQVSLASS
jgi:hypothetical protein